MNYFASDQNLVMVGSPCTGTALLPCHSCRPDVTPAKTEFTHWKTLQDVITAFSSSRVLHCSSIAVNLFLLDLITVFLNPSAFITFEADYQSTTCNAFFLLSSTQVTCVLVFKEVQKKDYLN